jgi:hypothetical protein
MLATDIDLEGKSVMNAFKSKPEPAFKPACSVATVVSVLPDAAAVFTESLPGRLVLSPLLRPGGGAAKFFPVRIQMKNRGGIDIMSPYLPLISPLSPQSEANTPTQTNPRMSSPAQTQSATS